MEQESKVSSNWFIPADMHGLRADQYLKRRIGRISRCRAQRIIDSCDFLLDGQKIRPSSRVKHGQKATLKRFAPDQKTDINSFVVQKIFEDDDLLVVNKPAGLNIHPSANCLYKTLTYWLRVNYPTQKINPCHRLDKETSGILVCAKNKKTESAVKSSFMRKDVTKIYLAVVTGAITKATLIDIPLGLQKDRGLVAIRMIEDRDGKEAITKIRPLLIDSVTNRTLVLCMPKTGRQHQIRAHLSIIGHPLVGDKLYGQNDEFFDNYCRNKDEDLYVLSHPRHALHAARLRIRFKDKNLVFTCPLPNDLSSLIEKP